MNTETTADSVPQHAIVSQLREISQGCKVWNVRDKDDHASCMHFESWEDREAKSWWEINREMHPEYHANNELVLDTIVNEADRLIQRAADMLEFLLGQFQSHSLEMGGQHSYRFRSGGWPMTHAKGPTAEAAILAAIAEVKREQEQSG